MYFSADKLAKKDETVMEECDVWGIGMSVSNGKGIAKEWGNDFSHLALNSETGHKGIRMDHARKLFSHLEKNYHFMMASKQWL